jgi:hypothetical protein
MDDGWRLMAAGASRRLNHTNEVAVLRVHQCVENTHIRSRLTLIVYFWIFSQSALFAAVSG